MTIRLTQSEFIQRSNIVHNYKYDYSKSIYSGKRNNVDIICYIHGKFSQLAGNHMLGWGCKLCAIANKTFTTEEFIEKSCQTHGDLYDYSKSVYINNYTKIKIICSVHGIFEQIPVDHYKHRCNQCAIELRAKSISLSSEEFINKSKNIHNDLYDYSLVEFKNTKTKVKIICKKHGIFMQKPEYHLIGCHCPTCSKAGTSQVEKDWLDSLGILLENRQITIKIGNKSIRVDGYNSFTNTIYEYYGDFWHGNPKIYNSNNINDANHKTFGQLYKDTLDREILIKSANYNLITKLETE